MRGSSSCRTCERRNDDGAVGIVAAQERDRWNRRFSEGGEREGGGKSRKWRVESRTSSEAGSLMAASFAALDFRPVAENGGGGN